MKRSSVVVILFLLLTISFFSKKSFSQDYLTPLVTQEVFIYVQKQGEPQDTVYRKFWDKQKNVKKLLRIKIQKYKFPSNFSQFGILNDPRYVQLEAKTKSNKSIFLYILHLRGNRYPPIQSWCDIYYEYGSARTDDMLFPVKNAKVIDAIFLL